MATYVILNLSILLVIAVVSARAVRRLGWKAVCLSLVVLLMLTGIFDSLIVQNGVVAYDTAKISGFKIGAAPVEDFAYTVAVVLLVPFFWQRQKVKP